MKWGIAGFAVAALLSLLVALWPTAEVSVRSRDPNLKIYQAKIWRWSTNEPSVTVVDYPTLRQFDNRWRYYARKIGIKVGYGYQSPVFGWLPRPENLHEDVLCLFGSYPKPLIESRGFDLITTNGEDCGLGYGSSSIDYARSSHRFITTNFGAGNFIKTNLHGLFWLRLHGQTNVVAEVRIR